MQKKLVVYWVLASLLLIFSVQSYAEQDAWILVDTAAHRLSVMRGNKVVLLFDDIAIGRYGANRSRMKGSNQTPLGSFRINHIKQRSHFYRFYGFDFPNREIADLALSEGRISQKEWSNIINAIESTGSPPQNTSLGGYIGIHGLGKGDEEVHTRFNWTNGCIAITNSQIDQLNPWLKLGTRVEIH
ncbi:hypothetical protein Nstercoris_01307 [Nitrosomonas stercoris]|uniref:L,D-TPase catalytic domain-containing protein n=1 Tax=Nitrosomonas stercoris TaxID=1444684 RepID=A0A4Y1YQD3_9PROT|nr:hypothetical protein Nstercoris_01307 [Nitrosomonas stercoris]